MSQVIARPWTSPSKKSRRCMHAAANDPPQISIGFWRPGWRRWQGLAPATVRHWRSTPAARFGACTKSKKSGFSSRFEHVSLFISQWTPNLRGSVPAYVRQTALFGQAVGKNEDNVQSHLPYTSPIVDHTFVWGGREGVKCQMKVLSFVRDVRTFEMTP